MNNYNVIQNRDHKDCNLPVIFLMGQTASGKTELAIALSQYISVEIISVDSALVYRGMDIGTAKPNSEQLLLVPHHLVDIRDPENSYSVVDFCYDARLAIKRIISSGRIPLLVGGSMFYFKSLFDGACFLSEKNNKIRKVIQDEADTLGWMVLYNKLKSLDPLTASKIHFNDHKRLLRALEILYIEKKTLSELIKQSLDNQLILNYKVYLFGVVAEDRVLLHKRIEERFYHMLDIGFENEVKKLISRNNFHKDMPSMSCIGYRQMWLYLFEKLQYHEMILQSIYLTRRLAKHQMTWLRKWKNVFWLNYEKGIFNNVEYIKSIVKIN